MKRGCVRDGLAQFDIKQYLGDVAAHPCRSII